MGVIFGINKVHVIVLNTRAISADTRAVKTSNAFLYHVFLQTGFMEYILDPIISSMRDKRP